MKKKDLSIGPDGSIRSGYDQPETTFMDSEGNDIPDERWAHGERTGQPLTRRERRAIADEQIERWLEWSQRPGPGDCPRVTIAGTFTRYRCVLERDHPGPHREAIDEDYMDEG